MILGDIIEPASKQHVAVYLLIDPISRWTRYVGQTVDPVTRYAAHLRLSRSSERSNPAKHLWIETLAQQGTKPDMEILGYAGKSEARSVEMTLIAVLLPYGMLTNQEVPEYASEWLPEDAYEYARR